MNAAREHAFNVTDVAGARPEPAAVPLLAASPDTLPKRLFRLTYEDIFATSHSGQLEDFKVMKTPGSYRRPHL